MLDVRTVLFLLGTMLCLVAGLMLIPAGVDVWFDDGQQWPSFVVAALCISFVGGLLTLSNQTGLFFHKKSFFSRKYHPHQYGQKAVSAAVRAAITPSIELSIREAFLFTSLAWVISALACSLPFIISNQSISFVDSVFEATSALTTTGATVFMGIEAMPISFLLWRAMLQWFGGIGIVVMAMIIFPILRIGGMQLFRSEFSDKSEKILPRVSQIAVGIVSVYATLTLLCMVCLYAAGMSPFESLCHAMATLSTGGLGTKDSSIQSFDSVMIEIILICFMILGGGTMMLYVKVWHKDIKSLLRDAQYRAYLLYMFWAGCALTLWCYFTGQTELLTCIRHSFFSVVSVMTTTGFLVTDYTTWGSFPPLLMVILGLVGGCTGSTSGGMKVFRIQVFFAFVKCHLKQLRRVHGVYVPMFKDQKIHENIAMSVFVFLGLYIICVLFLACILSLFEGSFTTSLTGAVAAMSNLGVGAGQLIHPYGSFSSMATGGKIALMVGMLLGRLELLTVLVLLMPSFWRR